MKHLVRRYPLASLLGGVGVCVFICLGTCCGSLSTTLTSETLDAKAQADRTSAGENVKHTLTAKQFAAEYVADRDRHQQTYQDKRLLLTGTPHTGGKHPAAEYCLPLGTDSRNVTVRCLFRGRQAEFARGQRNDLVSIAGTYVGTITEGKQTYLVTRDCVIVTQKVD